jgi:ATP-binding cassette subfamily F protein uup
MPETVLISLENICVQFGGKPLFEELRMHITEDDKICLVGKNGAGKTSLMRLILGELEPDKGTRFCLPNTTIGYLAQNVEYNAGDSVHKFVMSGLKEEDRTDDKHHLADMVITPLGLEEGALMGKLSGGQLRRAALARSLIYEPDILLLDEPTNHLDLGAIEWLEKYLASYHGAVVCVSHDRAFLSAISRKVFWIDQGMIRVCPSGYKGFEEWAEQIIEQEAREIGNMQKKLAAEIDWTQGGVSGRRKRNQRRLSELSRLRDKLKADKAAYNQRMQSINLESMPPAQASKIIVEFKHVDKEFRHDGQVVPILKDFNLRILRGDRIGILGRNGSGKSTFIKLLTGEIEPDKGRIFRGKTIEIAYFDQARSGIDPEETLWGLLCPDGGDHVFLGGTRERSIHVCGYLKDFMFDPKIAKNRISTLSGGQQNRLMLAKILANPGNVLILDEPTNDLDMDTLDMLQELLSEYKGTLIIVSHDRDFLDRTVTEVLAFEGGGIIEGYIGGYSDYAEKKKSLVPKKSAEKKTASNNIQKPYAKIPAAKALSGKERHDLDKLPAKITALEDEVRKLKEELLDVELYTKNPEKFDILSRRFTAAQSELEIAENRWLELEEKKSAAQ